MPNAGDVVLCLVQYTDTFEVKRRPALVLYEEFENVVVAGITSNTSMKGVPITRAEGAINDSVIKLNYLFTVSGAIIEKKLFSLTTAKRKQVRTALDKRLQQLA